MTPTQRSLALLRERGYIAVVVEKWVPWPKPGHRADLFGFLDILAVKAGETLGVQTTAGGSVSTRLKKIADSPLIGTVLSAGIKVTCHGWRKVGPRGKRKVWECREVPLKLEDFA